MNVECEPFGIMGIFAKHLLKAPDDWHCFYVATGCDGVPEDRFLVRGAVVPIKQNGKFAWGKKDKSTIMQIMFTRKELAVFEARWEKKTHLCSQCLGRGEVVKRCSRGGGTEYKPCPRCKTEEAK